jgi:cell division protein FtsQ
VVGTVAVVGLVVALFFVSRSSLFRVRTIEVTGTGHLSRAEAIRLAGVSRSTNALWLDETGAEDRLEEHAWIEDADVETAIPSTVRIVLTERHPVAVADDGSRAILLAADGTILGPAERTRGLPRIALAPTPAADGPRRSPVGAARALGAMTPRLRSTVVAVTVHLDGTLELRLRGGVLVGYGIAEDAERKARALEGLLDWATDAGRRVQRVSVVTAAAPAIVLR